MRPVLILLVAALIGGTLLYGQSRRPFVVFQAVMLPVFLWFFGADVMFGKSETTSSLWFLPFMLMWIVGTAALAVWSLKHLFKVKPT